MSTYMVFWTKGLFFGNAIGFGIGCLFTNIYIRYNYILFPANMKYILSDYIPKNMNIKK